MRCARVSARVRATPYTCRRAGGSVHVHIALVTVSESSKVSKSRLYVQTRGSGTLELWDDNPCGAFVPSSLRPRPCPLRADVRERDEGAGRDETRDNWGWRRA